MSELEKQLNDVLGEEKTKAVMQDLALIIAKYNLVKQPEICKLLFDGGCYKRLEFGIKWTILWIWAKHHFGIIVLFIMRKF